MKQHHEKRQLALMLTPYLAGIIFLIFIPAVMVFALSFYAYDAISPASFVGFQNFRELFHDEVFHISLRNSFQFIAIGVPLRLIGALSLALLLHKAFRGAGIYRAAVFIPTIIPDIAYALVWLWIFNPLYGPINLILVSLGITPIPWFTDAAATQSAVIIMSAFQLGEGFLIAIAARKLIPQELYEQMDIEGAGPIQTFWRLTLPLMAPILVLLFFRDIVMSFQATFVPALVMTSGGPPPYATTYLPLFIYETAFEYLRYGYAAAATLAMFLITTVVIWLQYLVLRRLKMLNFSLEK